MEIIDNHPPLIDEIDAAFKVRHNRHVIYAWGCADGRNLIYAPYGQNPSFALRAHELVHCDRQRRYPGGVEAWWREYIRDPEFRMLEEVPAHYAEYVRLITDDPSRNNRRRSLSIVAHKLSGPLYGNVLTLAVAKKVLELGPLGAKEVGEAMVDHPAMKEAENEFGKIAGNL